MKFKYLFLILLVLSLVLAACGGDDEEATNTPRPSATTAAVEPTEEATEVAAAPTEEATEVVAVPTEEATEVAAEPTEEVTEVAMAPTEAATEVAAEPTEEATEVAMAPTEEATEMAMEPTEEATEVAAEPTEEATAEATEVAAEPTVEPTEEVPAGPFLPKILAGNPLISMVVGAVDEAGLTESLAGGEFTLFVPTNRSLRSLPAAEREAALADMAVLSRHVVAEKIDPDALTDGQTLESLSGDTLTITITADGRRYVNGILIISVNTDATNGVIFIINGVIPVGE